MRLFKCRRIYGFFIHLWAGCRDYWRCWTQEGFQREGRKDIEEKFTLVFLKYTV